MTAGLPTREELASDLLVHRPADLFNPPALTNFLGGVQAAGDPVALWNLNMPPFACGDIESGRLYLDGWVFGASGEPVTYRWFPDRIERSATWRGLEVTSTTVLAWGEMAAIVRFGVRNVVGRHPADAARASASWAASPSRRSSGTARCRRPSPVPNMLEDGMDHGREAGSAGTVGRPGRSGAVMFTAPSGASSVQGVVPASPDLDDRGAWFDLELAPGETWSGAYVHAIGDDASAARTAVRAAGRRRRRGRSAETGRQWDAELAAVFTPGNDRYSGSLPVLESDDPDLRRLYYLGVLGVIYFKRDSPHSVVGRAYDTLLPRYWATTTFIWDFSLSSLVHALLDPSPMRGQLERWMALDVHACYGSDWLTGKALGTWYASNDHSLTQLIDTYLRWTGDTPWLDAELRLPGGPSRVRDQLAAVRERLAVAAEPERPGRLRRRQQPARVRQQLRPRGRRAQRGERVEPAHGGRPPAGGGSRAAADAMEPRRRRLLLDRVWALYADGEGWFNARMPDGRLLPVRHCYDLLVHARPARRRARRRGGATRWSAPSGSSSRRPNWMRALSPVDPDAITSVRPDHQWNGAYTAWPSYVATGLYGIGRADIADPWLRGLAESANQGLFGQAHFVDEVAGSESGGALKAPSGWPYINDWACSSGGSWARLVIQGPFGVRASVDGLTAIAAPRRPGSRRPAREPAPSRRPVHASIGTACDRPRDRVPSPRRRDRPHDPAEPPLVSAVRDLGVQFMDNPLDITGHDCASSIPLPGGQSFWIFGDTMEGPFETIRNHPLDDVISGTGAIVPIQDLSQRRPRRSATSRRPTARGRASCCSGSRPSTSRPSACGRSTART